MTKARTLADMISDGVIGTTELADDVITPVKLDETGNYSMAQLGVGIASPSAKIHVYDPSTDAALYVDSGNANGSHMRFLASGSVKHFVGSGGGFGLGSVNDYGIRSYADVLFSTGNSSTERMRIESSGNVGIGANTSLSRKLTISDDVNPAGYTIDLRTSGAYNSGYQSGMVFSAPYTSGGAITDLASIQGGKENTTDGHYGGRLTFHTRSNGGTDTERMRIDSSGNVGIGTGSPAAALEVSGSDDANNFIVGHNNTDFAVYTDSTIGEIRLKAEDGSGNNFSKFMSFYTQPSGSAATERMRISTDGKVGIGTAAPTSPIHVVTNGATTAKVETTGGTNSWSRMSLKTPSQEWAWTHAESYNSNRLELFNATSNRVELAVHTDGVVEATTSAMKAKGFVLSGSDITLDRTDGFDNSIVLSTAANNANRNVIFQKAGGGPINGMFQFRGTVTKPDQPMCDVKLNGNTTTSGAIFTTNAVITNNGSHWNSTSHRFVAPVTGLYLITLSAYTNYSTSHGYYAIYKNGSNTQTMHWNHGGSGAHTMMGYSRIFQLSANDYIDARRPGSGNSYFDVTFITVALVG